MPRSFASRGAFFLGSVYARGGLLPQSPEQARQYFRFCALQGESVCQVRLAKLLLDKPDREERDFLQAVAWLELAADQATYKPAFCWIRTADVDRTSIRLGRPAEGAALSRSMSPVNEHERLTVARRVHAHSPKPFALPLRAAASI